MVARELAWESFPVGHLAQSPRDAKQLQVKVDSGETRVHAVRLASSR